MVIHHEGPSLDGMTVEDVRSLIVRVDDDPDWREIRVHVIWIRDDGVLMVSSVAKAKDIASLACRCRFESVAAGLGYMGSEGAEGDEWVSQVYRSAKTAWARGRKGYQDYV